MGFPRLSTISNAPAPTRMCTSPASYGTPAPPRRGRMSAASRLPGLGRGLQALLGEQAAVPIDRPPAEPSPAGGVREIEIGRIRPNPEQPRVQFKEETIDELADLDCRARRPSADSASAPW